MLSVRMKSALISGLVGWGVLGSTAMAADANPYTSTFHKAFEQCSSLAKANPDTGTGTYFAQDSCYSWQVKMTINDERSCRSAGVQADRCQGFLANAKNRTPKLLTAAIQAAPDYLNDTVDAALQSGMDSYDVVAIATSISPQSSDSIAQRAIAYGADPTRVLEATAAGRKKHQ